MPKSSTASGLQKEKAHDRKFSPSGRQSKQEFREALGYSAAEMDEFNQTRKDIKTIVNREIDWDKTWSQQPDVNKLTIDDKIRTTIPHVYGTRERYQATQRFIYSYFNHKRYAIQKYIAAEEHRTPVPEDGVTVRSKPPMSRFAASHNYDKAPTAPEAVEIYPSEIREHSGEIQPAAERYLNAGPEAINDTGPNSEERVLQEFLSSCNPPLDHLLPLFQGNNNGPGISPLNVKSLSLIFQFSEVYAERQMLRKINMRE